MLNDLLCGDPRAFEVAWYRKNGKHPKERIKLDSNGCQYVVGDFSWNRNTTRPQEYIEPDMMFAFRNKDILTHNALLCGDEPQARNPRRNDSDD